MAFELSVLAVSGLSSPQLPRSNRIALGAPIAGEAAFKEYYQPIVGEELTQMIETLERPLPLDVRVSPRAALAARALKRLQTLQIGTPGRKLQWVSGNSYGGSSAAACYRLRY